MAPRIPADTPLTDRDLLLHVLEHVETLADQVTEMHDTFARLRPLITRFVPRAEAADAIAIMQAARENRRGSRRPRLQRGGPGTGR